MATYQATNEFRPQDEAHEEYEKIGPKRKGSTDRQNLSRRLNFNESNEMT